MLGGPKESHWRQPGGPLVSVPHGDTTRKRGPVGSVKSHDEEDGAAPSGPDTASGGPICMSPLLFPCER